LEAQAIKMLVLITLTQPGTSKLSTHYLNHI